MMPKSEMMSKSEMMAFALSYLAHALSRARILVNGQMCASCEKHGPDTCARCWEERAWAEADRERKRRAAAREEQGWIPEL